MKDAHGISIKATSGQRRFACLRFRLAPTGIGIIFLPSLDERPGIPAQVLWKTMTD